MAIHDVKPGSVSYWRDDERVIVAPHDLMYSAAQFCATHFWSKDHWKPIYENETLPTFLTLNQNFAHLNVFGPRNDFGVTLNGVPVIRWETADSERGYVDAWQRCEPMSYGHRMICRHRLFGVVRFVAL